MNTEIKWIQTTFNYIVDNTTVATITEWPKVVSADYLDPRFKAKAFYGDDAMNQVAEFLYNCHKIANSNPLRYCRECGTFISLEGFCSADRGHEEFRTL